MYRIKWVNETGGDWINDAVFNSIEAAKSAAAVAFSIGDIDDGDVVQAWEVDAGGNALIDEDGYSGNAIEEWVAADFF